MMGITINLGNLNWHFARGDADEHFQLIQRYLRGDRDLNTVNILIKFIADAELNFHVPEEIACRYLGTLDYFPVSLDAVCQMWKGG